MSCGDAVAFCRIWLGALVELFAADFATKPAGAGLVSDAATAPETAIEVDTLRLWPLEPYGMRHHTVI